MEVVHPGQARELVWSAECWPAELAGLAFAETKQLWLGACDPRCGTCATLAGDGLGGGTGGTGSFAAHIGGQISSHGTTSLYRRFAISVMVRGMGRSHNRRDERRNPSQRQRALEPVRRHSEFTKRTWTRARNSVWWLAEIRVMREPEWSLAGGGPVGH